MRRESNIALKLRLKLNQRFLLIVNSFHLLNSVRDGE